ncbi:ectoine/hydroxyectoine ABC transporter substrate-binding protein EhuB [Ornithinibacillus halophilus]|uniref:Amino acid ABC transporter substrate-binding protein, PAAT family n=1 Tax=Ornithinibacillus halophilus TaxID=930117 RepID=A0A1M5DLX3_9BACI|nr:ectoine/hydroxyectoine ABC transporter substrate-binding protein EhuB [Ornithinibacillus halophilus]SHF67977.1 amino acid ABC transporter substrate-binding protein, PAAT family [Ornithinibacillus halophilus]
MKKIFVLVVLSISILLLASCGSDNSSSSEESLLVKLQEEGKVTVGLSNEKPYAYIRDGELKGAAVEIAEAVFHELGIDNVESHLADYSQLIPGINAGKFDVITAGMGINPDRCENVIFAEPELKYGYGLIVPKGNPLGLKSYKDIADNPDVEIATMAGAMENGFLKSEGVADNQIVGLAAIPEMISAVESGRADVTTGTDVTIKLALESANTEKLEFISDFEQPDVEGVPTYGAAGFHKDSTELRDAYNEKLAELKEDGTIDKILEENGFAPDNHRVEDNVTEDMLCDPETYSNM